MLIERMRFTFPYLSKSIVILFSLLNVIQSFRKPFISIIDPMSSQLSRIPRINIEMSSNHRKDGSTHRLGQPTGGKALISQLQSLVFECALEDTFEYLKQNDNVSYEWFDEYIDANYPVYSNVNHDEIALNIIGSLRKSEKVLFKYKKESELNADVTMEFTHVIVPRAIAQFLTNAQGSVLKGRERILLRYF